MNAPMTMTDLKKAQGTGNTQQALVTQQTAIAPVETASSATAAKVKALVQARYEMAVYRPRDLDVVRERMLKECRRPSFAEVAKYSRPQGKKQVDGKWIDNVIEGPGIRFAEMAIRCMTNLVVETMTIYDDREKRIVNVSVTDLEGNVPYAQDITIQKAVERSKKKDGDVVLRERQNSNGYPVYLIEATDDDIMNKQNALISKAIRTLGLRLVPGDIIDECMDVISATQRNVDAQDPDAAKRRLFDSLNRVGVTVDDLKKYLGHSGESLNPKELEQLRGIYAALKDGETTWRTVMDGRAEPESKGKTPPVQPKFKDAEPEPKKTEPPTDKPDEKPAQPTVTEAAVTTATEPVIDSSKAGSSATDLYIMFSDYINDAISVEELDTIVGHFAEHSWVGAEKEYGLLKKKVDVKRQALSGSKKPSSID